MKHSMIIALLVPTCALANDFATQVLDFTVAPGQFVRWDLFVNSDKALGPPDGGGTRAPSLDGIVTLGGFGGSITLGFDEPVENDPLNPLGMDAIVFGNAFWGNAIPTVRYGEPCVIEISEDVNANGLADDPWYPIQGSHPMERRTQVWDADTDDEIYPPFDPDWVPFDRNIEDGSWETTAFQLPGSILDGDTLANPDGPDATVEFVFGYADCSPTIVLGDLDADNTVDDPTILPGIFYTRPDDPHEVGMTPGSGGGDAFDIDWAVDPDTGLPVQLERFHFIRISTALEYDEEALLGEVSGEIDAVADVRPLWDVDLSGDCTIDIADLLSFLELWFAGNADVNGDGITNVVDLLEYLSWWLV